MNLRETFFKMTGCGKSPQLGLELFGAIRQWDGRKVDVLLSMDADPNVREPLLDRTPLFEAAQHGHDDMVLSLIKHGAKINVADKLGRTPLVLASGLGDSTIYNILMEYGADPLAGSPGNRASLLLHAVTRGHEKTIETLLKAGKASPQPGEGADTLERLLQLAAEWGQPGSVRLLLAAGANAGERDKQGRSVLELAVRGGNEECVAQIAGSCPEDLKIPTTKGSTLLQLALEEKQANSVKGLLAAGCDKNEKNQFGSTPLHHAAEIGCKDCLQALLGAGADFRAHDPFGRSPFWHAVRKGNLDCVISLLKAGADPNESFSDRESLLAYAAGMSDAAVVKAMVDAGADIHKTDKDGHSVLRAALKFSNGKADTVKVLLDAGADTRHVSEGDKRGERVTDEDYGRARAMCVSGAVFVAAWKFKMLDAAAANDWEGVKKLLEAGAPPDTYGRDGNTALMIACKEGDADVVRVLLEHKANPLLRPKNGNCPPLFHALLAENAKIVAMLCAAGVSPEQPGLAGEMPLNVACANGDVLSAKALLRAGAGAESPDSCGETPIFAAISSGCAETVAAITAAGAKVNVKNPKGYSALELAEKSGNDALIKIIRDYRAREIEEMAEDATCLSGQMSPLKTLRFKPAPRH
jgi:ankyrin repeat protein